MSAMRVPVPTSHKVLPRPRIPDRSFYERAAALRQSLVRQSGITPGRYTSLDKQQFSKISLVFENLSNALISDIAKLDVVDTCELLYKRHEEVLGLIEKYRYQSIPDIHTGNQAQFVREHQDFWREASHLTEPIRWLIEVAVKHCVADGLKPNDSRIDWFIALAWHLFEWDGLWEHVSHSMLPHEIIVEQDFAVKGAPTSRSQRAVRLYEKAMIAYSSKSSRIWAASVMAPQIDSTAAELVEETKFGILSEALQEERGYSLSDLLTFVGGLIDSFKENEYVKPIREDKLSSFLHNKWQIQADQLSLMLADFGLSEPVVAESMRNELMPVEHARRDSRIVRRPIVIAKRNQHTLCIYGIETLIAGITLFLFRLDSGRIPSIINSNAIKKAMGQIQTSLGDEFRDKIARQCAESDYQLIKEKSKVHNEGIPQDARFGPIDVFIIDKTHQRFVLVEAKDDASEGLVPRLMKEEFDKFQGYIAKLESQVTWFRDRVGAIKDEYSIPSDADYRVEGVIVVNQPRLWMYTSQEPLPIVGDIEFLNILKQGGKFHTVPAS